MSTEGRPAYFERIADGRFVPTVHAGGAWSDDEQHFSPVGGLLIHEIDRHRAGGGHTALRMGRVSFDILGRIGFEEFEIQVETVRPGRTIELVQATMLIAGRSVVTARAWFLAELDTGAVAGGDTPPLPGPETAKPWSMDSVWSGGFIGSIEARRVGDARPGRATAWVSTPVDLVAGEQAGPTAAFIALVDTANGVAVRQDPAEWMFPNLDLTIHLFRRPEGEWTGLDTAVTFGATGQGLTSTVLHDVNGPVGCAQQILTVRPQPPAAG